ncbi:MAG: D-hexose-6-phosphate mutarotase [Sulfurimonadaceae bacterium]|nr:D-hexose-6-phosphate mutarotase [Sulfurimonadaceae bacterium]
MLKHLPHGFPYLHLINDVMEAKIALQGAHLFSFKHEGKELLWVSEMSDFTQGKAIRGGVPICWPSFGDNNPALSQHGFARTAMWELVEETEITRESTKVVLRLANAQEFYGMWSYHYEVRITFTLGKTLKIELTTTNQDTKPFELTQALHTYFSISDIKAIKITGLENKPYLNALTNQHAISKDAIVFDGEFDAVFQEVDKPITLLDKEQKIKITNKGSASVVVWNPWIEKCARMSGMACEDYKKFVCIESANAYADKKRVAPNESHTLEALIEFY